MNSTNLDFIALKYGFSNIANIKLHFLQLWRAPVFKYFSYFRLRFYRLDRLDYEAKKYAQSCHINHNFFNRREKILDINIKSIIIKVRVQKGFPSKVVPPVRRIKMRIFASILTRTARVSRSILRGLLLLVTHDRFSLRYS